MIEKKLLKQHAKNYLPCYFEGCKQHEHCLHWLVGPHVPDTERARKCVNVMNKEIRMGNCPFFRPDTKVLMKRGFHHLYDDMPKRMGTAIRESLEQHYGHTMYYKYRNGVLPVTPAMQEHIAQVCRKHGWNDTPVYNYTTEEYMW